MSDSPSNAALPATSGTSPSQPESPPPPELQRPTRFHRVCVAVLLVLHAAMLAWIAYRNSPVLDEVAHLPSGISHWQHGRFDLYRVNPPLVRSVAAIPVMLAGCETDWSGFTEAPYARPEFTIGRRFCDINGFRVFWLFTLSRFACIPFSLIGGWFCYVWARDLYGAAAVSGQMVEPQARTLGSKHQRVQARTPAAASLGVMAGYAFWRWTREPVWPRALLAGLALGAAELTKTTWIILFGLWPALWLVDAWLRRRRGASVAWRREAGQLGVALLLGMYLINLAYGFENSFQPLGKFRFLCRSLGGAEAHTSPGNRFKGTWLAAVPVPVPANYLQGIDVQKSDFEKGKWSYLRGEHKFGGWWYYYLYALAVKEPVGIFLILFLAFFVLTRHHDRLKGLLSSHLILLAPVLVVFVLVSSQTGFSRYLRYVLPTFPFVFIWIAQIVPAFMKGPNSRAAVLIATMAFVSESLWVYPHSLSFFSLAISGPRSGPKHLLDANIDWGQDVLSFMRWVKANPLATPLYISFDGFVDPGLAGVRYRQFLSSRSAVTGPPTVHLPSGWYAFSANSLYGYPQDTATGAASYRLHGPAERVGYSILIFRAD